MKQNKYDDPVFFEKYRAMDRSRGLDEAGEWPELKKMLPPLAGLRVLDLGCGFGWHCGYALEQGAASAVGVDISEKMLAEARRRFPEAKLIQSPLEDVVFPDDSFDLVLSSLAFHYLASFDDICAKAARWLAPGGFFVFTVEHPVFTAEGRQDWCLGPDGAKRHWPVDRYFEEGPRQAVFLGEEVTKYHRTLGGYLGAVLRHGFQLTALAEPTPGARLMAASPLMRDELRRPMMLIVSARQSKAT